MKKERTSVLLNQEDMLKLKTLSQMTSKSTSFLIQEAVTEFIAKSTPERKIGIAGMIDSGETHLAEMDEEILDKIAGREQ